MHTINNSKREGGRGIFPNKAAGGTTRLVNHATARDRHHCSQLQPSTAATFFAMEGGRMRMRETIWYNQRCNALLPAENAHPYKKTHRAKSWSIEERPFHSPNRTSVYDNFGYHLFGYHFGYHFNYLSFMIITLRLDLIIALWVFFWQTLASFNWLTYHHHNCLATQSRACWCWCPHFEEKCTIHAMKVWYLDLSKFAVTQHELKFTTASETIHL